MVKIEIGLPEVAVKLLDFIYQGESTRDQVIENLVLEDMDSMTDSCAPELVARLVHATGFYKLLREKGISALVDPATKRILDGLDQKTAAQHVTALLGC